MDTKLKGKTGPIAGASRNMGRAGAIAFAQEGANLAICTSTRMDELKQVADEARSLGVTVVAEKCDITDGAAVSSFVKKTRDTLGRIDVAVTPVGYRCELPFLEESVEAWTRNMEVNLTGPFHICRNVIPLMIERNWGRIINISGMSPLNGIGAAKAMVKLGIVGLTRGLAREFGEHNITANCIAPGAIDRPPDPSRKHFPMPDMQAVRRLGKPRELVSLMLYLASEDAGFITGQCYSVNGGVYFQ